MRQGTITIGEKEVRVAASGATPYKYKVLFGRDLMDFMDRLNTVNERQKAITEAEDMTEAEKEQELLDLQERYGINNSLAADVTTELLYIMVCDAEKKVGTKNGFMQWLESFDTFDIQGEIGSVIEFYVGSAASDVKPKNPDAVPTEG